MAISTLLALDSLAEQVTTAAEAEENARLQMAKRNNLIRDAVEAGIAMRTLIKITGLSRNRIYVITQRPQERESA